MREHMPQMKRRWKLYSSARTPLQRLKLGQARGAAICAAISPDLPVAEYSPRSVKQAIVGRGGADKVAGSTHGRVLLSLQEKPVRRRRRRAGCGIMSPAYATHGATRMQALQKDDRTPGRNPDLETTRH